MLIYGFDIATRTGVAIWDTDRPESAIECYTLDAFGSFTGEKAYNLGRLVQTFIKRHGPPNFVAIEKPLENVASGTAAAGVLVPTRLCGAVEGILGCYGPRFEEVSSSAWRKDVYGFGRKTGWKSADWKRHARQSCETMGIATKNADEAEAALIAFWCGRKSKNLEMIRRAEAV